ncbi:hypothetical protein M707_22845 [Arthrobacter sp. AK-YN10]|nr:hypothetical protein M707_22845 [Arthrobacter sp. AK-YN10]
MLNANLINVVTASLRDAGITSPELSPIRAFPKPTAKVEDLTELLLTSDLEDPYQDPRVIALGAQLYIQSLSHLDQGHHQRERQRQAAELEARAPELFKKIQAAFDTAAKKLVKDAEPLKGVEEPSAINGGNSGRATAEAAINVTQGLAALERTIKAWWDLWLALGNTSYGVERGKPFTFMNPNVQQWDSIRRNPTIWEAVRAGIDLTLAERPEQVSERFQAMLIDAEPKERERQSLLPAEGYGSFRTN